MPSFFWAAQTANAITWVVSLAALLIVLWLGPRRWTNLSFACLLVAVIIWMSCSFGARLMVNLPQLGGDPSALMNWVALGFALIGITLFWFVESFYPLPRRWRWAINALAAVIYALFIYLLARNEIVINVRRGADGGIDFDITPLATALSAFHYVFEGIALFLLARHAAWRTHRSLLIGALIVVATTVTALIFPATWVQTYSIAVGMLFMTYEVVDQQLFNPLVQLNHHLESEVQRRTAELAQSLEAQERVKSELAAARTIQLSLLPHTTPRVPNLRVAGCSIPAKEVGGDFFAYHSFADGRLGVAVGDVSGKGIPAALLMALALNTFETLVDAYSDQGALLTACNGALAPRMIQSKQNAAFLSVVLDSACSEARVANAGLVAPLLWRCGCVEYIESFGLPLGATHSASYAQETVELRPGDRLLLVSDGIVEAMNGAHELWGFERLEAAFRAAGRDDPATLIETILAQLRAFTGDAPQHDDMTMVAIEVVGDGV
ncbi:MAG TPA: PP2C family protein-serine/threonine phosphatase [Roseiflexaceae bacterium]|nr:PP2C family protein-serine/threonine phosphatase [Roseiflexaceae bacterium]